MIRSISWKVTVAYSSAWMLVLLAAVSGYTQPVREATLQQKITLHSEHLSAETVLQRIEALAQIHFVYSSSLIELNKTLDVSFYERPLREVLDVLGRQLGLELKMQGSYVILKKLTTPQPFVSTSSPMASRISRPVVLNEAPMPVYVSEPRLYEDSLITYRTLKRSLLHGKSDFGLDTAFLRRYLKQPVNTILKPAAHTRWQVSLTMFANDYSVGTEVRAGLRGLYVVANTGYMRSGYFRNGFGAGSSITIKPGVLLNPIYSYARMKSQEDFNALSSLKVTSQHHQVKLLLSLAVTNHLGFQIGPTFNVLKTHFDFQRDRFQKVIVTRAGETQMSAGNSVWTATDNGEPTDEGAAYTQGAEQVHNMSFAPKVITVPAFRADFDAIKSWVGFETGITYSINFSRRP